MFMLKVIGKAAAQAKKEFANKAVLAVITARLSGDALTGGDAGLYAPLFASQNKLKFSIKEGPDALTYSAMGNAEGFINVFRYQNRLCHGHASFIWRWRPFAGARSGRRWPAKRLR